MELPKDNELSTLSRLGEDLYEAEAEVLRLEAELRRAQKVRDTIKREEIPDAMAAVGVTSFTTNSSSFRLKDVLSVRPAKARRPDVLRTLESMGDGDLIKNTVTVAFGRGEDGDARELVQHLEKSGRMAEQVRKVEPATLKSWVRKRLAKGDAIDHELFGVQRFQEAVFEDGAPKPPIFDDED